MKMPLGVVVGLGPGDIVLDGDPAHLQKGAQHLLVFGPCLFWPNSRPSQQLSPVNIWEKPQHPKIATKGFLIDSVRF